MYHWEISVQKCHQSNTENADDSTDEWLLLFVSLNGKQAQLCILYSGLPSTEIQSKIWNWWKLTPFSSAFHEILTMHFLLFYQPTVFKHFYCMHDTIEILLEKIDASLRLNAIAAIPTSTAMNLSERRETHWIQRLRIWSRPSVQRPFGKSWKWTLFQMTTILPHKTLRNWNEPEMNSRDGEF